MSNPLSVCVIGGGSSGLVCGRVLKKYGFNVTIFEKWSQVGGTWFLNNPETPLYKGLKTNLPKELMAFSSLKFDENVPSFMESKHVEAYLQKFCKQNKLEEMIRFDSIVKEIKRPYNDKDEKWLVSVYENKQQKVTESVFDAVIVANGHFNVPFIPSILEKQIKDWKGEAKHSKFYRVPEEYRGKSVLIVGAKSSGGDIARELDGIAKSVHLSDPDFPQSPSIVEKDGTELTLEQKNAFTYKIPESQNIFWHPRLTGLKPNSNIVEFEDGNSCLQVDTILFCTGYQFEYDFIPKSIIETPQGKRVRPIYNEIMHAKYADLFFVGLNQPIVPFPFVEVQAEWIAKVLSNPNILPPFEERMKLVEKLDQDIAENITPITNSHVPFPDQFQYLQRIAKQANLDNLDDFEHNLTLRSNLYYRIQSSKYRCPGRDDKFRRPKEIDLINQVLKY